MSDCILWHKSKGSHGYGQTWDGNTVVLAHRVAYEREVGPIPDGLAVDHMCNNKPCVNVEHMELKPNADNVRRYFDEQTHCRAGRHLRTEGNTKVRTNGYRRCLDCQKESNDARYTRI